MRVIIEVYASLYERLKWRSKVFEFPYQEILLEDLIRLVPDLYEVLSEGVNDLNEIVDNNIIFINGIHAQFRGGLKAVLRDGDVVAIFPPAAGG